tara:strand:- start:367 stop:513 length:147 start_codon:yes stop_codon:yes gene_type:complete
MFPLKIGNKIYIHPFQVASEKGIWKYYTDSDDESNSDTSSEDNWEELK